MKSKQRSCWCCTYQEIVLSSDFEYTCLYWSQSIKQIWGPRFDHSLTHGWGVCWGGGIDRGTRLGHWLTQGWLVTASATSSLSLVILLCFDSCSASVDSILTRQHWLLCVAGGPWRNFTSWWLQTHPIKGSGRFQELWHAAPCASYWPTEDATLAEESSGCGFSVWPELADKGRWNLSDLMAPCLSSGLEPGDGWWCVWKMGPAYR